MAALGSLVVKLALEYAQYTQGLNKSEQESLAAAKRIQDTMDGVRASVATSVGTIVGTIAAGLSINAFKNLISGAIESNAALNDMAIQASTTVEALSGLASIGKYSDVGAEQITASMNKLTKNLAGATEESKGTGRAVQALGLDLDKFRQLKPEDQMMAVAKALGESAESADKSAIAIAIYGKEGAKMLPFLKDLAEVGELQAKVTAAQAAAADSLSDNMLRLRTSGDAWKKELANAMIPALDQGVQAVLGLVNGTGGLRGEVQRLAADGSIQQWTTDAITGLSYVVDAGEYVWRVIKTITLGVAGLTAGSVQMLSGNFRGAAEAFSASWADITRTFDSDTMGAKFRARLAEVQAMGDQAVKTRKALKFDDTTEPKAKKEAESEYDKLVGRILERISLSQEEILVGRQLTEVEKFRLKVLADMEAAGKKLTDAERARIQALLDEAEAADLELQMGRSLIAQAKELAAERQKARNADYAASQRAIEQLQEEWTRSTASVNDRIKGLQAEADATALAAHLNVSLAEAVELVTIARLRDKQQGFFEGSEGWQALEREIQARQQLLGLLTQREQFEQHRSLWASIDQTAHDTFVNVLQGGQDMWTKLKNTGKSVFFDWLYSMTLKRWIISIGTSVGGAGAGTAIAGTGGGAGGSALGAVSNAYSAYSTGSSLMTVGSQVFGGTMSLGNAAGTMFANATGAGLDGLLMANGAYGTAAAGSASSMMASLATAAPYIAAAVVIANALGLFKKTKKVGGGIGGTVGDETELFSYDLMRKSGSLFSGPKYSVRQNALDAVTAQGIQDAVAGMLTQARTQAATLGAGAALASFRGQLGSDLIHPDTGGYGIKLDGLSAEQAQQKIQAEVQKLYDTMATQALGEAGKLLMRAGETAGQTLTRLSTSLTTTNAWLSLLRQRLFQVGLAGGDAASQLADAFGGLDKLTGAAQAFYETFYTEGERAADSQRRMAEALAAVNLALPDSRAALRAMAEGLDLSTEAGRKAYATLLQLAPEFAATADLQARLARETAERLLDAFSARQQLVPLLAATVLHVDSLAQSLATASAGTWQITRVLGDLSSGVLSFGDSAATADAGLSAAQQAAQALGNQVLALRESADRTVIDVQGLADALAGVDTQTFVATVSLVFERLGERVRTLLGDITGERIATREAALQIINPAVMTRDQIARGIAAANVGMPGNAGVVAAQARLLEIDRLVAAARTTLSGGIAQRDAASAAVASTRSQIDATTGQRDQTAGAWADRQAWYQNIWTNRIGSYGWRLSLWDSYHAEESQFNSQMAQFAASLSALGNTLAGQQQAYEATRSAAEQYGQQLAALSSGQTDALAAARQAQLAYVASLQTYALDASKAVTKLGRLREETVKYYEAQQRLAELMGNSAAGLRKTVGDYRFAQLTPQLQLDQLQTQFSTAYAMALSTSGETLAGYGDKLGGLLGPLLDKAGEVLSGSAYNALVATTLARAEAVAGRIEQLTPVDYAADSLALLGQIDTTLAALEDGAKSAERVIADAVKAGADQTTDGLRQVVNALTGHAVSYFAAGGAFTNGVATGPTAFNMGVMGEAGSEGILPLANVGGRLGVHAMGVGGGELVQEVRALRGQVAAMSAELAAFRRENRTGTAEVAGNTGKAARQLDRIETSGVLVYGEKDQPVYTKAAA